MSINITTEHLVGAAAMYFAPKVVRFVRSEAKHLNQRSNLKATIRNQKNA